MTGRHNNNPAQQIQYAALTDVGMRRANNQDSHSVMLAEDHESWLARGHLFLVCDGMGAHAAGELASKLAADGVPHLYNKHRELSAPEALKSAIVQTNAEVNRRGKANADFHNMGTTCSAMALLPQGAIVGHVGDSRVYRLRGNLFEQLTFDHSLVWELRAAGKLGNDSDLAAAVPKNVITRSLGPYEDVKVDVEGPFPLEAGDTFLLCSDGLSGEVTDAEIGAIVANLPVSEAAQVLIDLANLRGGPDNITVLIAKVTDHQAAAAANAAQPIVVGRQEEKKPLNPALVIAGGAFLLAALVVATNSLTLGAISALVGIIILGVAFFLRSTGLRSGVAVSGDRQIGSGPYTKTACHAQEEFINQLKETLNQLRDAAVDSNWEVEWGTFDAHYSAALKAEKQGDASTAVQSLCRGLSFMMDEVRAQNERRASDSQIDL